MCFKIDWASLIFGSKFPFFALFYFVFEGKMLSTSPRGANIWRGDLTESFFALPVGGLIFGGAYTWMVVFSEVYQLIRLCRPHRFFKSQDRCQNLRSGSTCSIVSLFLP